MHKVNLKNTSGAILFTCSARNTRQAIEMALKREADLRELSCELYDLRFINLRTPSMFTLTLETILYGANLRRGNFHGTIFFGANLIASNFAGADLGRADFTAANLAYANFYQADLRGAKFCGTNIYKADFTEALIDGETALSAGVVVASLTPCAPQDAD